MKSLRKLSIFVVLVLFASCTEDIVIDVEEGDPMIGVEAYFTDELKHHETILSYTSEFYDDSEIKMVSGATVYVTDGVDTVYYIESQEKKGHYFTDLVAGQKNKLYRLCIDVPEVDGEVMHLYSERSIPNNVDHIDSIVVKPYFPDNGAVLRDTIELLYPYFQCPDDSSLVFMPLVWKNDTLLTDTLSQQLTIPVGGYAGYYINGEEMLEENKEIFVYMFRKNKTIRSGDQIRLVLRSIQPDYLMFYYSVIMSSSSNPMFGAPANVSTNIQPGDKAVGWFFTASTATAETIFVDDFSQPENDSIP